MVQLGARIKALRERKGLNQSELARECGIAPATISRLESGDLKDVQTAIATRLAQALGVSIDYLVGRYEDEGTGSKPTAVALVSV
jgi:transcriptional regulator with XRE-family HTH domain